MWRMWLLVHNTLLLLLLLRHMLLELLQADARQLQARHLRRALKLLLLLLLGRGFRGKAVVNGRTAFTDAACWRLWRQTHAAAAGWKPRLHQRCRVKYLQTRRAAHNVGW
jgi:hypothetical protein